MNQSPSLTLTRKCGGKWPTGSTLREPYWGEEGRGAATLILLSWWEGVSTLREPYWGEEGRGERRCGNPHSTFMEGGAQGRGRVSKQPIGNLNLVGGGGGGGGGSRS